MSSQQVKLWIGQICENLVKINIVISTDKSDLTFCIEFLKGQQIESN